MQYGDEIAVTDSEKKITYLELNQKAICIGQYFMEKGITEMGGRLHISWDVVDELFEACIIDEIFLEFVEDIKRIKNGFGVD